AALLGLLMLGWTLTARLLPGPMIPQITAMPAPRLAARAWSCARSEFTPDQEMIERDRPAPVHEEIKHAEGPHQRVFEPELIPEIAAYPPALVVGHDQENQDRQCCQPCEQAKRQQRTAEELRDRDRRCPEFPRPVAVPVELLCELPQIVRAHAGRGPEAKGVAQPVRHQREPHADAQQHLSPGRERLVEAAELRNDQRGRALEHGSDAAGAVSPVAPAAESRRD